MTLSWAKWGDRTKKGGGGRESGCSSQRPKGTKRKQETKMVGLYRKEQPLGWRVQIGGEGYASLEGPVTVRD